MLGLGLSIPQVAARGSRSLVAAIRSLFAANEPGVWYDPSDLSTLFQDSAGTTPVTAVEQPVGLMLDKSKGLAPGPELVTNGDFSNGTTGWSVSAGWSISSGVATGSNVTAAIRNTGGQQLISGKWYLISVTVTSYTSGTLYYPYSGSGGIAISGLGVGTFTYRFNAPNTDFCYVYGVGFIGTIDNISVRELHGNHASQPTATSRPVLSARYNLLTKTEQFDDAVWGKQSISAVTTTALNGTQTAFKLVPAAEADAHVVFQAGITPLANCVVRFYAKAAGYSTLTVYEFPNASSGASFNLATGSVTNVNSGVGTITPAGDGWYLCTVTVSLTGVLFYIPSASSVFVGDGASGVTIWRPSVVASNDGANLPPYQRVNTATDYDTVGFPHYLRFDGIDDWLVTNTITPGTDKAQVFAGVRKLSDAAHGTVVELGLDTSNTSIGAFCILSPASTATTGAQDFQSRGTAVSVARGVRLAPSTNILTGLGDISGDRATLRINGVQAAQNTADQGTGNFLAYPLYIGRRGGTTFPFNGRLYSLIVRFGSNLPIATIEKTEKYINTKTRAC